MPMIVQPAPPLADSPQGSGERLHNLAQVAHLNELDAKIEEDQRMARALRVALEGNNNEQGARAREAGCKARACILPDDNVDIPMELPRTSQKLIVVVTLLRAVPEPAIPEGQKLHLEAQMLVENTKRQQVECSTSCLRHSSITSGEGSMRDEEASVHMPRWDKGVPAPPQADSDKAVIIGNPTNNARPRQTHAMRGCL